MTAARSTPAFRRPALAVAGALLCGALALPQGARAENAGHAASQERPATGLRGISVSGPFRVVLRQSGREHVALQGDEKLLPLIHVEVEGDTLVVRAPSHTDFDHGGVTVTVDFTSLEKLRFEGAGQVEADRLAAPHLEIETSGAYSMRLSDIETERFSASVNGADHFELSGHAKQVSVEVAGMANVVANGLIADAATVEIDGMGKASVHAEKTLDATVNGIGMITYDGEPTVHSSVSLLGIVKHR